MRRSKLGIAACLAALSLAAGASPAGAAVTIGQPRPASAMGPVCGSAVDWAQATVTSGNSYVVPGAGTITSWSHNANGNPGQELTMKVFRKVADPAFYQVVGHDGPEDLDPGLLNTFTASIPVKPGDVLGIGGNSGAPWCIFQSTPGDSYLERTGNLADGQAGAFALQSFFRVNISAVFVPSNSFSFGKAKLNAKKGTATLTVDVPNPGTLTASGKGVKATGAGAVISKTVSAPGKVKLKIRAKGKTQRTLNETGKVKVKPKITYTPTGGDPSTQSTKVKLKKG